MSVYFTAYHVIKGAAVKQSGEFINARLFFNFSVKPGILNRQDVFSAIAAVGCVLVGTG